jgi:transcription elongation GreA/GreB family factor
MNKQLLVEQLTEKVRDAYEVARRTQEQEKLGYSPGDKRMATAQAARANEHAAEVSFLETFSPKPLKRGAAVSLGAIIEVEDEEEGRTFFLAPVGAGLELTGPGGDGFLVVITPQSPLGRALLGKKVGDFIEVEVRGESREWSVTYIE